MTPVVEFKVRFGPGDSLPIIDQVYGGVPASTAKVTLNGVLMVPLMGDAVVIPNTGGGGA